MQTLMPVMQSVMLRRALIQARMVVGGVLDDDAAGGVPDLEVSAVSSDESADDGSYACCFCFGACT